MSQICKVYLCNFAPGQVKAEKRMLSEPIDSSSLSSSSFGDTNRTEVEGLFFYYPRLLYCLDQMLAVMLFSQHRVSSSKIVRPIDSTGRITEEKD